MSYDNDNDVYKRRGHYVEVHTSTLNLMYFTLAVVTIALIITWLV